MVAAKTILPDADSCLMVRTSSWTRLPGPEVNDVPSAIPDASAYRLHALSTRLVDLHRESRRMGLRELQSFAFEAFGEIVPFDSGAVGNGVIENGSRELFDAYLYRQPPELLTRWPDVRPLDRVAAAALSAPGRTRNLDVGVLYADEPRMLRHCREFGQEHWLTTMTVDGRGGLYQAVSVFRADRDRPFSESDRFLTELFVPHFVEAMRTARLQQLGAHGKAAAIHPSAAAVVNSEGVVVEAEPGFVDVLSEAFPLWSGPRLPDAFEPVTGEARSLTFTAEGLYVESVPSHDLRLLRVRRATQVDALTSRELEVAKEFARGASAQAVGKALGIATNTVRVHLCRVYGKLGVGSKTELARVLAGH